MNLSKIADWSFALFIAVCVIVTLHTMLGAGQPWYVIFATGVFGGAIGNIAVICFKLDATFNNAGEKK